MKITYEANDGTKFNRHSECEEYELELIKNEHKDFEGLTNRIGAMYDNSDYGVSTFIVLNISELSRIIADDLKETDKQPEFTVGDLPETKDEWEERECFIYK